MAASEDKKIVNEKLRSLGLVPSGLFIVCARDGETKKIDGYLASWIQQISFDPLLISMAIKPGRPAYDYITSGQIFTVNIIGDFERGYMKYFWKGYNPEENPFTEVAHQIGKFGGVIIEKAKAVLECRMHSKIRPGDHDLVIAEVVEGYFLEESGKPVTHTRKSGLDY